MEETLESEKPESKKEGESEEVTVKTMSSIDSPILSPFEGLQAHRMGCLKCKYVENIRHEKFGPMVLALTHSRETTLYDCLEREFEMEVLEDVECAKCTLLSYQTGLTRLIDTLTATTTTANGSASFQLVAALADAKTRLKAIEKALKSGKIDDPRLLIPTGASQELKKFLVRSPKTKHHMIARPPTLLTIHIQRSSFHNYTGRALKNQSPVQFPLTLDMSRYVTTSTLSMDPEEPISQWREGDGRTRYRLRSVVVHYGVHHMGHYVAYRLAGATWYRISDEDVE